MASINGINNSTDYSALFSSVTGMSSGSDSQATSSSYLTDYASVKNGSLLKLAKSYYKKIASEDGESSDEASAVRKENAVLKKTAGELKSAAGALTNDGALFTKKTVKNEDGTESTDYDRDKIYKTLKNFVDSYNSIVKKGGDSDNTKVLRNTLSIVNLAKKNKSLLSDAGIEIKEDNTLSISEEAVKSGDINSMKSLFSGVSSFADMVASSASSIASAAEADNGKLMYNAVGSLQSGESSGNIYDSFL